MESPVQPIGQTSPQCAHHPLGKVSGTCDRCGRFVCNECGLLSGTCGACVDQRLDALPSSAPRATWTIRFLYAHIAADAANSLVSLSYLVSPGESDARSIFEGLAGLGLAVVAIATPIAFLRWLHLSVRQANALGMEVGVTPGWAVGYWFVPIANLYKPFQTVKSLAEQLGATTLYSRLPLWWGAWIVGNIVSQVESRLMFKDGLEEPVSEGVHVLALISGPLSIAGAVLLIGVVGGLQTAFQARRTEPSRRV